ncbi:CDP-alcohol phosphatidyltransferase family protein [Candidatus Dependentiae bacterium]
MKKLNLKKININKMNLKKFSLKLLKGLPEEEKRITWPTIFTLVRIILAPFIVGAMVTQHWGVAFWLFLIASLTDVIDGNLARWFNQKTFLGACLDPIADKVLLISCFATLAFVQSPLFSIPTWFVLLVLIKDSIVLFGALIIFISKGHLDVRPTILGKLTTFSQVLFITWLFSCYFFKWLPMKTYCTMLTIVSFLVIASLFQYVKVGLKQVAKKS